MTPAALHAMTLWGPLTIFLNHAKLQVKYGIISS